MAQIIAALGTAEARSDAGAAGRRACAGSPARRGGAARRARGVALTARSASGSSIARRRRRARRQRSTRARACRRCRSGARRTPADAAAQHWRRSRLRGRWLAGAHRLPRQPADGRPRRASTSSRRCSSKAPGDAVLVQRGWVPRNFDERAAACRRSRRRPARSRCAGRIAPPPSRLYEFGREASRPDPAKSRPRRVRRAKSGSACCRCRCWQPTRPRRRATACCAHWPRPAVDVAEALRLRLPVVRAQRAHRSPLCLVPTRPPPPPAQRARLSRSSFDGARAAAPPSCRATRAHAASAG